MSTLLLLCLCIVLGCVCYVMYVTFAAETRRLNRIIDDMERRLGIVRKSCGDITEDELNRLRYIRL